MTKRYEALDGLRAIGAVGILMMHIRGNAHYEIDLYWYKTIVPAFTDFVFLYMIISAFSMCCGYFEKIKDGKMQPESFYKKRFARIWPFFALLVAMDLIVSPGKNSLYEGYANLTLAFGLLPNAQISVIGVGWFLGVVFLFYMLFPYFVFLCRDLKHAWLSFGLAYLFNFLCVNYFFNENHLGGINFSARTNIVYCAVYFFAGGLIFWHRNILTKWADKYRWIILFLIVIVGVLFLQSKRTTLMTLSLFSLMVIYALGERRRLLCNRLVCFIGGLSMEIYLSHMVIYRILEKIHLLYIFENHTAAYFVTVMLVLTGAILFSICAKGGLAKAMLFMNKAKTFLDERRKNG